VKAGEARRCPVCGAADEHRVLREARVDVDRLGSFAFASRKAPELMHWRLLECRRCDTVYASPAPSGAAVAAAYATADFDTTEEARYAAATYARVLAPLLGRLESRHGALDIGTGDGALLRELLRLGFDSVQGVEPSAAPIRAADPAVRPLIREGVFDGAQHPRASFSLITCMQTIEHVPDPLGLCRDAATLLRPGGMLVLVCHDRRAPLNRVLGPRSPIYDVEHLQLLSRPSLTALLERAGLRDVGIRTIRNRYPLVYWLRLLPLPIAEGRKQALLARVRRSPLGRVPVTLPVGNLVAWGTAPRATS
jgi:SAM-dependent methyltransferase